MAFVFNATSSSRPVSGQLQPCCCAARLSGASSDGHSEPRTTQSTPRRCTPTRRQALSLGGSLALLAFLPQRTEAGAGSIYDISPLKDGRPLPLSFLSNKVTLFVNVATYCVLTPQYGSLAALHDKYESQGFEIVASPCDQFGHQEPGSDGEICEFARMQGARFLVLDKLNVNDGPGGVAELYRELRNGSPDAAGRRVSWNFEKFLVGKNGAVLRRYKPGVEPEAIEEDVRYALKFGTQVPPRKKVQLNA